MEKRRMAKILWVAVLVMAVLALTACSGGKPQGMRPETRPKEERQESRQDEEEEEKQDAGQDLSQKQDEDDGQADIYERGTVNGNYYESKWLGIKLNLSDDYVVATQEEFEEVKETGADLMMTEEAQEKYAAASTAVVPELLAVCLDGSGFNMNISIAVEKLPLSNITAEQYVTLSKRAIESSFNEETAITFGDMSEAEIAGETYLKMPITSSIQGVSMNMDMYVRVKDGYVALITVTYSPEQSALVEELIASIQKYE